MFQNVQNKSVFLFTYSPPASKFLEQFNVYTFEYCIPVERSKIIIEFLTENIDFIWKLGLINKNTMARVTVFQYF